MRNLTGIFFLIFMTAAFMSAVPALYKGYQQTGELRPSAATNGKWASLYEREFAEVVPPRVPSLTLWGMTELLFFEDGRKGVLIGEDGWLFTDEEFMYSADRDDVVQGHLDFIKEAHATLKEHDTGLIVALIPAKARVTEEHLGRYRFPTYNKAIYKNVHDFLRTHSIVAPDLYTALSENEKSFLKTDTHWSPIGAKAVAIEIAATVQAYDVLNGVEKTKFALEPTETETLEGDLTRYVPAGKMAEEYGMEPMDISQRKAVAQNEGENEEDSLEDSLFGDVTLPVTLVGTSYSANPTWNFEDYLKTAMQTDILNAADEGRGPFETMKDYLESEEFKSSPPKLVIWEIPERYVVLPDTYLKP